MEILRLLIAAYPDSVRSPQCPLHAAAKNMSLPFCKILIDANKDPVFMRDFLGYLPIHEACLGGNLDTLMYLSSLNPESISAPNNVGRYLIHLAALWGRSKKVETLQFILKHDPEGASRDASGELPLFLACCPRDENLDAVKLLFDAYPEAIDSTIRGEALVKKVVRSWGEKSKYGSFLQTQLAYDRLSRDYDAMTTQEPNGWLPLHRALHDNASLGAVKLLARGNHAALQVADHQGSLPLHIACKAGSVDVIRYLAEIDGSASLYIADGRKNYPLHIAAREGNCEAVLYLLERQLFAVSERNVDSKTPFHLLCESKSPDDIDDERRSAVYIDCIWQLLLTYPDVLLDCHC